MGAFSQIEAHIWSYGDGELFGIQEGKLLTVAEDSSLEPLFSVGREKKKSTIRWTNLLGRRALRVIVIWKRWR